jgi:hypothetical protein
VLGPVFGLGREVASSLTTSLGADVSAPLFDEPLYAISELQSEMFNSDYFEKLLVRTAAPMSRSVLMRYWSPAIPTSTPGASGSSASRRDSVCPPFTISGNLLWRAAS